MLDLNELEKMVDEALAKETVESLSEWIDGQRTNCFESFLGSGYISHLESCRFYSTIENETTTVSYKANGSSEPDNDYKNAA